MNIFHPQRRILAFTLAEMFVVVVILGGVAGVAIPRYLKQRKIVCNQEGVMILKALYEAQTDHNRDKGTYLSSSDDLAISFDGQSNCFGGASVSTGTGVSCAGNHTSLASIPASDSSYTLHVADTGKIICLPCGSSLCKLMGY